MSDEQEYEVRQVAIVVSPKGEPVFSELATKVEITDDGAGEFIKVTQARSDGELRIDPVEWRVLRGAIDQIVKQCR